MSHSPKQTALSEQFSPVPSPDSEVSWLDDDEQRLWRAFVAVSGGVVQEMEAALKQSSNLTFGDYEVLVHLSEAPERRLRMSDLSDRLLHSHSRVTQRVDRLTKRGFVDRERCTNDGRVTYTKLTPLGLECIEKAAPYHVVHVRHNLMSLIKPDEIPPLVAALERVAEQLRSKTTPSTNTDLA